MNAEGRARMVDVTDKTDTQREARAEARVYMKSETLKMIKEGQIKKGDVLAVAQVAGVMAAKKTSDMIPMCHPLFLTAVDLGFVFDWDNSCLIIESVVKTTGRTGVEMEALTAVSVAALTVYDMCKSADRWMRIDQTQLLEKLGGKSGHVLREDKHNG